MVENKTIKPGWVFPHAVDNENQQLLDKYFILALNDLASNIKDWANNKGFDTPTDITQADLILAKLMLIVSELGEACEAVRKQDMMNFIEELADTFIRLFHLTAGLNIDIAASIANKMAYNESRPYQHGKKSGI